MTKITVMGQVLDWTSGVVYNQLMSKLRQEACRKTGLANKKHGMTHTPTYRSWRSMRYRCQNPNDKDYKNYGAKSIKVDKRWESFENFYKDMGERPSNTSIDRIDTTGNYEPNNCRWATSMQQSANTKQNRLLEKDGKIMHISAWARYLKINRKTIYAMLERGEFVEIDNYYS